LAVFFLILSVEHQKFAISRGKMVISGKYFGIVNFIFVNYISKHPIIYNNMTKIVSVLKKISTSVLIAKTELFSCEVLGNLLEREGFNVLGRATELNELIDKIRIKKPLCVIVENSLLEDKSRELIAEMANDKNKPKFIVYANSKDVKYVGTILSENFSGYLHTGDNLSELYNCLKNIHTQPKYYSEGFKNLIKELGFEGIDSDTANKLSKLSKRERQILQLVANGLGGKDIASTLGIAERTLANQRQTIIQKLNIDSSRHLLKYALTMKNYISAAL
jgi:DNA-binding NarL/FixJ family response regulator